MSDVRLGEPNIGSLGAEGGWDKLGVDNGDPESVGGFWGSECSSSAGGFMSSSSSGSTGGNVNDYTTQKARFVRI